MHPLDRALHRQQLLAVDDRVELDLVLAAIQSPREQLELRLAVRVPDTDPQQEAVQLRLGQRIGPLVLDRVLGGEHEERALERAGAVLAGDLALLHRLQQRRLGLRRRTVDLVAEQDVREDRPGLEAQLSAALVVDRRARSRRTASGPG